MIQPTITGRTGIQIEQFYSVTRFELSKKFDLMDVTDESYQPVIKCSNCCKPTPHSREGIRVYTLTWVNPDTGNEMKTTGPKNNFKCTICGWERPFGAVIQK